MEIKEQIWICTNCGYSASKPFEADICPKCHMTFWKCLHCACTLISASAPERCPECDAPVKFQNITCYIPDWEDPEHMSTPDQTDNDYQNLL